MRERVDALAIRVTPAGEVQEVLVDEHGRARGAHHLLQVFDHGSRPKAEAMLEELAAGQVVRDLELLVREGDDVPRAALSWLGWEDDGDLLLVGATSELATEDVFEELLRINNEQANLLRRATAEQGRRERSSESDDVAELMELNNELAAVQRELARRNAQLRHANQEKDRVLGMVAHDLRNPLSAVHGLTQLLLLGRAGELDATARKIIERIAATSGHMRDIVGDLVDVAAITEGRVRLEMVEVEVAELVDSALGLVEFDAADRDIALDVELEDGLVVRADVDKLRQVLTNLVGNAVKYSPPESVVQVRARSDDDLLVLEVTDEGPGIPEDEQEVLFEPYGTTSVESASGEPSTGLGLAIVARIVEAHAGVVGADSRAGDGSTFTVELPLQGPPDG